MSTTLISRAKNSSDTNPIEKESCLSSYLRRISRYKLLSSKEEVEIAKRIKNGDKNAKKELIQANLRLVVNIAKKLKCEKLTLVDLIQEGNLGLMIAAEKFNYKLGYKFSTYASFWIKQTILKAISEQSYGMKIPVYIQETVSKFSKVKSRMEKEYNFELKNEFVAKKMNLDPEKMDFYISAFNKTLSLEMNYENNSANNISLKDIIPSKANSEINTELEELKKDIGAVLTNLKQREQEVLKSRFGLENRDKETLENIGKKYGVTKECIRQTELRAINKLKNICKYDNCLTAYL